MTQITDAATRLDDGQPAVEVFTEYVRACEMLGYQHHDLTRHLGQVRDWYDSEDGLDLRALDADCATLAAAAASAEEALRVQDTQLVALAGAWQGRGAHAAREFLLRHGGAAEHTVAALHTAATTLAELRDNLWRAIDGKVTATMQIEGRAAAQREAWLAAARTLRMGLGDRSVASELIDQQVKPFVHNDIGGDWLGAMRTATAAVADAYGAAVSALRAGPVTVFDIPGDLGPTWSSPSPTDDVAPTERAFATTAPAGFAPSSPATAPAWQAPIGAPGMPMPSPAQMPPAAPIDPAPAMTQPAMAQPGGLGQSLGGGVPGLGSGLPDMGSGVSGIGAGLADSGQQLADLFSGLIGSAAEGLPGEDSLTDEALDLAEDAEEKDPKPEDDDGEDVEADEGEHENLEEEEPVEEPPAEPADEPEAVEPEPVPPEPAPVVPPPPLADPPAESLAAPAGETPCEIAADELPQVGQ
ncbi:hypothetical protein [Mycolicibacterium sp. XJ870]